MRKHNYVVGYTGEYLCIYGAVGDIIPMTLPEAKRKAKTIYYTDRKGIRHTSVVYKLVRVK